MEKPSSGAAHRPFLSVVVPVYERWPAAARAVEALRRSAGVDLQIIVVDDGSLHAGPSSGFEECVLLRLERNRGPAYARNEGLKVAEASWVVFVDSDVVVQPDTLLRLWRLMEAQRVDCTTGVYSEVPLTRSLAGDYKHAYSNFCFPRLSGPTLTVCAHLMAIKREAFCSVGGFDPALRQLEDEDFSLRFHQAGYRAYVDVAILVDHDHPMTVGSLLAMDWRRGYSFAALWVRHRAWQHRVSPAEGSSPRFVLAALAMPPALLAGLLLHPVLGVAAVFAWGINWPFLRNCGRLAARRWHQVAIPALFLADMAAIGAGAYVGFACSFTRLVFGGGRSASRQGMAG